MGATATEGLRERKKRRTREAIAKAAMELFAARGFDDVTVAEIARAADVSEKTVFNHFPAKEDLVFSGGEAQHLALLEAIRSRPAGESVVEPFRRHTLAWVEALERDELSRSITVVPRLVAASQALRDRVFIWWEKEADILAPLIASEVGAAEDDVVARVAARTLAWTHRTIFRAGFQRLMAGEDRASVAADLRVQTQRAYDQVAHGLADYGVRRG
jgi:AcrR family transcriptional regulator